MSDAAERAQLNAWDDAHLWHPFTPQSVYRSEDPLMVVAGDGHYLIDADGHRYLDGVASLWCNLFGHRRPEIDRAIHEQLGRIAHSTLLGHASEPAVRLAKRLIDIAPEGLPRVFFSDNGSTAVEVALKLAYQYWQQADGGRHRARSAFLTLDSAYHGDTIGSVSAGGIELFHERYRPLLFETIRAPSPYGYRCPPGHDAASWSEACIVELERLVLANADRLAAVVMEPGVQGAAGMIVQPEGFVRRVREITARTGTLLILDEVAVGFGRSGRMFASEREGVSPDLLCLAKGLTGGYLPMAATLATERIFGAFLGPPAEGRTFFHGHTYTGNQLAAAAAHAVLDIFERDGIVDRLPRTIAHLSAELERLRPLPAVGDIRQYGLAAGIELVADRATKAPFPSAERRGMQVCRAARSHGVFLRPLGDVIVLMPPLTIADPEITHLIDALACSIREVC
ncbi:MAG TPA: adenosylmethionine--8-amino-7-oxononanoate transaminase [Gemmatimonadales bacterium]|nr:adenosylmethionine--8-amino-7-oxononanoate transaminase [Gemmatimonadales bacterium]